MAVSIYFLNNHACSGTWDNKSSTKEILEAKRSPKNTNGDTRNHWKFNKISENDVNTT
jgi:hypothetical protein